jgi:TonB family protein
VAAAQPDTPPIAQQQGITGDVEVVVTLDANSRQSQPPTVRQSPSRILNAAAIDAARQSRFQTEIRNCTPIAAQYLFIVEFTSQ